MVKNSKKPRSAASLEKTTTGIAGFDDISIGGLPKNRPTLIAGGSGCGKTLFATEFLARGANQFNEPGVFVSFEESAREIIKNTQSLGFNFPSLIAKKKIIIEEVLIDPKEFQEAGEYNLEGLFIRLENAINSIGAKRVVLDTVESLFTNLPNQAVVRAELVRLFRWLKNKRVTAVITGEKGINTLTRYGLEEYVADCVIFLDNRIIDQVSTRRLRIVKYRGSLHGTNEYPFLITEKGISVLPITSLDLNYLVSNVRISSGIPRLDSMLGGKGFYKGSSILISGSAGTGKTSFAATLANAACKNHQRVLYFAFEESVDQIIRNLNSINIRLEPWIKKDLLQFHAWRPSAYGLEMHLLRMHNFIEAFKPDAVIVDPITNFINISNFVDVKSLLSRLIDFLKMNQITTYFTCLIEGVNIASTAQSQMGISSLMDTWIVLENMENNGEQNKTLRVLKSRGMNHSNQIREILISAKGIDLKEAYVGSGKVLIGTARYNQETQEKIDHLAMEQEFKRRERLMVQKRAMIASRMQSLSAELEAEEIEFEQFAKQKVLREKIQSKTHANISFIRGANSSKRKSQ
jgi:circadian clock protein KaiC